MLVGTSAASSERSTARVSSLRNNGRAGARPYRSSRRCQSFLIKTSLIVGQTGLVGVGDSGVGAGVTVGTSDNRVRHRRQMCVDAAEAIQKIKEARVRLLARS